MRVTCFGSGSSGNAFLLQSGETNILIDAGIPIRQLRAGLTAAGVRDHDLDAVLISHEHHDHISALPRLRRYHHCPLYASPGTINAIRRHELGDWEAFRVGHPVQIGQFEVTPIAVAHDAAEPVGFFVDDGTACAAFFTDLGRTNEALIEPIQAAHLVVLEANYDDVMLDRGPYPAYLKRRIRGGNGHLSNAECGDFLFRTLDSHTDQIWLAHLSENNNHPSVAERTVNQFLGGGSDLPPVQPLPRRGGKAVVWDAREVRERPRQIGLPLG